MKRLFSILIVLQLFTNQEAFAELAKLPFLFHHYNETGTDKGFLSFIKEHYSSNDENANDHEHGKLPFKHSEDGCSHHTVANHLKDTKTENEILIKLSESGTEVFQITDEENFPTYTNNIWQPPKIG